MKRVHIKIKGTVQGIFFRKFIKDNADKLNLKGWVKNIKNYVEAVFEGSTSNVHKMLILCKTGPEGANITSLNIKEESIKDEKSFQILR
ncbi:MAG: acylphosphatase [Nanoarchaeota archaeon]|nr:acylphosphatase [Nanoarchaeota archaeon]